MKILVTGAAGFIGFHTCKSLAFDGHQVYGIDNINNYYNPILKFDRLEELGINTNSAKIFDTEIQSSKYKNFKFSRTDIGNEIEINYLFKNYKFDVVCNLAAQAGVRYSLENPKVYIDSNIVGFLNILEACRNNNVKHLVYASSSSVYGENKKIPFEISDNVDYPISLYAATKKSNELMAHTYGHLYGFRTTGLRFFTVYGPWGRPDMAYFLFSKAIIENKPIKVFNHGKMERDFTYIDDIVSGISKIINKNVEKRTHYKIYNIGNNKTEKLEDFIGEIEKNLNKKAIKKLYPIQPGDVPRTYANIDNLYNDYGYKPSIEIKKGISKFIEWYLNYNKLNK
jgi:UDP-glucuronate 4-epimerase